MCFKIGCEFKPTEIDPGRIGKMPKKFLCGPPAVFVQAAPVCPSTDKISEILTITQPSFVDEIKFVSLLLCPSPSSATLVSANLKNKFAEPQGSSRVSKPRLPQLNKSVNPLGQSVQQVPVSVPPASGGVAGSEAQVVKRRCGG